MSLQTLLSARSAIEAVKGTDLPPTRLLYFEPGQSVFDQNVGTISPDEARASYASTFRVYPGLERDKMTFAGDLTYDDAVLWGQVFIKGGVTGVGAGADKTWAYQPTLTADDLKSLTVQFGASDSLATATGWKLNGLMGNTLELKFAKDQAVHYQAELLSYKAAAKIAAFTASLSDRTNVSALGTTAKFYCDTTTIGSTQDTNIIEATWKLDNKLAIRDALDGTNTGAEILRPMPYDWSLSVVRYFANATEMDAYLAKTERKVRITTTGPTLGSTNYGITLDLYGYWDTSTFAIVNGLYVANMTLKPIYDATGTGDYKFTTISALTTIS